MGVALLVGDRQAGKTLTCRRLAEAARGRGLTVGGIIAPAVHEAGHCVGYDVVDLTSGCSTRLATADVLAPASQPRCAPISGAPAPGSGEERAGCFHFHVEGLAFGRAALAFAAESQDRLIIVDEVGPLELAGGGWAAALGRLSGRAGCVLLVVRRGLVAPVAARWGTRSSPCYDVAQGADAIIEAVLKSVYMRKASAGGGGDLC
jgi:nucleoside-triphosphatase THEP1